MGKLNVNGKSIEVPDRVTGKELLDLPEVQQIKRREDDVVFLVDDDSVYDEVRPEKEFELEGEYEVDRNSETRRGSR